MYTCYNATSKNICNGFLQLLSCSHFHDSGYDDIRQDKVHLVEDGTS